MWKCKKCGGTKFKERVIGGYELYSGYDEKGEPLDLEESDYETEIECDNCGNSKFGSHSIKSIAEWVEENDRENSQV